jgi:hypothetical protein
VWMRAGVVRWDGARYFIEQEGMDVLRAWEWQAADASRRGKDSSPRAGSLESLARIWTDSALTLRDILIETIAVARHLFFEGLNGDAAMVLMEAARAARLHVNQDGDVSLRELSTALFALWTEVAAVDLLPRGLDRLLYELARVSKHKDLIPIGELAQAALDIGQDPIRATARLEALAPFTDVALERTRASLRMLAARSTPPEREREVLEDIETWASTHDDAISRARLLGWRGRLAYRLNDFEASAALHLESARALQRPIERAAAFLNSASACTEAFRFEDAISRAESARETLGERRHPLIALRIEWVTRWARYRRGDTLTPDPPLLDAAECVGIPNMFAPLLMLESAVHFRAQDKGNAAALARRASSVWSTARVLPDLALLCQCLALACGDGGSEEVSQLAERAADCETFGIEVQALGLLRSAGLRPTAAIVGRFETKLREVPLERFKTRLDVLSASEALLLFRQGELGTLRTAESHQLDPE